MAETLARFDPVPAASAHPGVTITLAPAAARYSVRMRAGIGLPEAMLASAPYGAGTALHLGPDEWLVILPEGAAAPSFDGPHAVTEISDRNLALLIEGPKAEALLQTGCPLDLSEPAFPIGKATRTLFETVEIVLWRESADRFHVEVWRSFAPWLWDALTLTAGDLAD